MKGSLVGLGLVLGVLDFVRVAMLTLVELRKYENRRKAKDGHFLPRRIKREDDKDFQAAPPPRLWKQAVAAPPLPPGPGSLTARPPWLPKEGSASGSNSRGTPSLGNLPVGAGPPGPPGFSAAAMAAGGNFSGAPPPPPIGSFGGAPGGTSGPGTPKSQFSGTGRSGFAPNPGGATPGTPGSRGRGGPGPPLQTASDMMGGGASGSRGPSRGTSPRDSSLHSLAQSLKKEVKAGIHPNPPPPPGATSPSSSSAPPPPPSGQRPAYQRPPSGSRPTSAQSSASKARAPGPPPPPGS